MLSVLVLFLAGCVPASVLNRRAVPVSVHTQPLAGLSDACAGRFVAHDLPHITTTADNVIRMYEANGAGVALHDFDNDGDLDMVLGNYDQPNSIFWNLGGLDFRQEQMPIGRTRAVNGVDVDGDGWTDLVLTRVGGAVNFWRNRGDEIPTDQAGRFDQTVLDGFTQPAYAMDWADLDGDGDLDAVTATYDIGLLTERGNEYLLSDEGGVYLHWNEAGRFRAQRLSAEAQALALVIWDQDEDGRPDLLIGNDFGLPDEFWRNGADGWHKEAIFPETTHSTMSFDLADVDNGGSLALFASDMKPADDRLETLAAWKPLMDASAPPAPGDPQRMENVLLSPDLWGRFHNQAQTRNLDASGWSWSGLFGDLDQDGLLDLYIVNGFAESTTFAHLPDHELVEKNMAFANLGTSFVPRPDWGLGSSRGGRGAAQGDLDGDGDLDIVVNNLRGQAQLFENRLCGGSSLLIDLRQPGTGNPQSIGATVFVETGSARLRRDVRVTRGYLSGDPGQLHFGLADGERVARVRVRWPDAAWSLLGPVTLNQRLTVVREEQGSD